MRLAINPILSQTQTKPQHGHHALASPNAQAEPAEGIAASSIARNPTSIVTFTKLA